MNSKMISAVIADTLNATYTYLMLNYSEKDIDTLKEKLLILSDIDSFEFHLTDEKYYSYEDIQEKLSNINEKETCRKNKGVYYTPSDVVQFIANNCIKAVYGKLVPNKLNIMDLSDPLYYSFCTTKLVLDPTCGAGEFLLFLLETKFDLLDKQTAIVTADMVSRVISTIYGNDINNESIIISKIRLFLCAINRYGVKKCLSIDEKLNKNFSNIDFVSQSQIWNISFDLIIGNPPYVESTNSRLTLVKEYGNIYANVLKNAALLLKKNGVMGFIIPLSYISTPRMKGIRNELFSNVPKQYILSFADRPDCLFKSVHQKLCILIGEKNETKKCIYTNNYQYWYKEERGTLFEHTAAIENEYALDNYIPKLGTTKDIDIYKKIYDKSNCKSLIDLQSNGYESVYVNMRATFWIKAFRNCNPSNEYKCFHFQNSDEADYFSCLINSSLFWWFWTCVSDGWHITNKELSGFKVPDIINYNNVSTLVKDFELKLEKTKIFVGTKQVEYEYKHRLCIDEIHNIDDYVNNLYGLTEDENKYIKEFAFKYRMSGGI